MDLLPLEVLQFVLHDECGLRVHCPSVAASQTWMPALSPQVRLKSSYTAHIVAASSPASGLPGTSNECTERCRNNLCSCNCHQWGGLVVTSTIGTAMTSSDLHGHHRQGATMCIQQFT